MNYRTGLAKANFTTHGKRNTRLYNIWTCVKQRCNNPNHTYYHNYGGRGIKMCKSWSEDFMQFYNWSMSNGYNDTLSLDRIDNDLGYEPSNCKWSTRKEQNNNSRNCHYITFRGKTQSIQAWADEVNLPMKTLSARLLRSKWSVEKALTTPILQGGKRMSEEKFSHYTTEDYIKSGVIPVCPMTAKEPLNNEELEDMLNSEFYYAEEKLDGTRAVIHIREEGNRTFSRRISKKTGWYAENSDNLPHIRDLEVDSRFYGTILDGELRIEGGEFKDIASIMNCLPQEAIKRQEEIGKATFHCFDINTSIVYYVETVESSFAYFFLSLYSLLW